MYNWSVDETKFKRDNPAEYNLWRITQLINYGLDGEKLDKKTVKKAWPQIKNQLDPDKRQTIEFFIWGKKWHKEKGLRADRRNFWRWFVKRPISSKNSI